MEHYFPHVWLSTGKQNKGNYSYKYHHHYAFIKADMLFYSCRRTVRWSDTTQDVYTSV